jgi:hypothetical protein
MQQLQTKLWLLWHRLVTCAGGIFTQELNKRNTFLLYALAADPASNEDSNSKVCTALKLGKLAACKIYITEHQSDGTVLQEYEACNAKALPLELLFVVRYRHPNLQGCTSSLASSS